MSDLAKLIGRAVFFGFLSITILPAQAHTSALSQQSSIAIDLPTRAANELLSKPSFSTTANVSVAANEHPPGTSNSGKASTLSVIHPTATAHLPPFITAPGETDILMSVMTGFLGGVFLLVLVFYFRLHALPEHIAHRGGLVQYQLIAVLALLSLFTHNHIYWVLGLLLAMVRLPDFATPLEGMAASLARMADGEQRTADEEQGAHVVEPVVPRQRATIQSTVKDLSHA
jgi:hypothetical protein